VTGSDLYSLGCVIYAVHSGGSPPFKTHGSLSGLRESIAKGIGGIKGFTALEYDLQSKFMYNLFWTISKFTRHHVDMLSALLARHTTSRPTPSSLPSYGFFSSLPISTLNFLDRSNFSTKTREEKVGFMKGLSSVLDKFTEGLKTRKILPSLLEEV
jgi:SCY1-like protein 2